MLELFTAQWAGFLAKEKKVHTLANTPQATILAIIYETCCWPAVMLLTAMQYLIALTGSDPPCTYLDVLSECPSVIAFE